MKNTVIMGVGNMLFSDEGMGYHAVKELEKREIPEGITIHDAATLGLMSSPLFEGCDLLVIIDAVDTKGEPGDMFVYNKDDIMLDRIPVKLSPHQIGIQETLLVSELRGKCPKDIIFIGVIPASYETSIELTPIGKKALVNVMAELDKIIEDHKASLNK